MFRILILFSIICLVIGIVEQQTWDRFKTKHKKKYSSAEHERKARATYEYWDEKIQEHNIRYYAGKETYKMGHNRFSDLTPLEFQKLQTLKMRDVTTRPATPAKNDKSFKVPNDWKPTSIDLRTCKIPPRDQGNCGSCWAFSAVATIEWYLLDSHDMEVDLSEQNLVDCSVDYGGCEGGTQEDGFEFFITKGLDFEKTYPYNQTDNHCKFEPIYDDDVGVSKKYAPEDYYVIPRNETKWAYATENYGWLSVSVATGSWQHYEKGILKAEDCSGSVDHAVVIVGYDRDPDTKMDYWIIRNSWGDSWGDKGHIKIERNNKACKIREAIYIH